VCLHFGNAPRLLDVPFAGAGGVLLDSADSRFGGPGGGAPSGGAITAQPQSVVVLEGPHG
jgi:hypothetical protein